MIIGGFLGSGKTTTLLKLGKHLSETGHKIAIIVNEIGEIGLDGDTLSSTGIVTEELTSGCICCTLKISMEYTLAKLSDDFHPDVIIIEPTGIAFPRQIKEDIGLMKIDDLSFAPIVNIVDGTRFNTEIKQTPKFILTQIEDAEILCINKVDIAEEEKVAEVRNFLEEINPEAEVIEFSAKEVDEKFQRLIDLLAGKSKERESREAINSIEASEVSSYSGELIIKDCELEEQKAEKYATDVLTSISKQVKKLNPDFVGHIKMAMEYPGILMKASITSSESIPHIEFFETKGKDCSVKFLSAVTNVEKEELVKIVEGTIKEHLEQEGIPFSNKVKNIQTINIL
ncbi:GTPase, G3E family [Methanococcoides vulcani]|uniref:GTPase, G3E family n=1 Tax=Methanococcoides vulcani TaxID=1353158 RepID=A0A1I0AUF0_9EURY|nr:GTP-binding protein [Methanococcoides vulcani]SES98038.1 GTPase, G3E family [Methanococcoides vulcani]